MMRFYGGFGLIVEVDRHVSYAEIEQSLNGQAILEGYSIDRREIGGSTRIQLSIHISTRRITAAGVPELQVIETLRAVTAALDVIDRFVE